MFQFLETIAITSDGARNLSYHQKRVNKAFEVFFPNHQPLALNEVVGEMRTCMLEKCRIVYETEIISISREVYVPKLKSSFQLVRADNLDYSHKFSDRSGLEALQHSVQADDIIIVKNGLITDSSYGNVAFYREGKWITPETPLLPGTMRQFLLDTGLLLPMDISCEQVYDYEKVLIYNSMIGFCPEMAISVMNILSLV